MRKNLILVANKRNLDPADFQEIAARVSAENSRIDAFVVTVEQQASAIPEKQWRNPTLVIAFGDTGAFQAPRGLLLQNRTVHKYQQYVQFSLAGVPTPHTANFSPQIEYSEEEFGEFTILKPIDLGKMGKGGLVRLQRTRRLSAFDRSQYPEDHPLRTSSLLLQSFIDTGVYAVSWRVLTLLGEPLYCFRSASGVERPPLDSPDELIEKAVIEPKHPEGKAKVGYENLRAFVTDGEIMDFARKAARAFPRVPLQGCDIVREAGTGKLYVLEVNPGGNTWHFSSPLFVNQRTKLGGKESFTRQLDAFNVAARILAQRTDELAL
jgi:hypothetical protein